MQVLQFCVRGHASRRGQVISSTMLLSNTLTYLFGSRKPWLNLIDSWCTTANQIQRCYCATSRHWQLWRHWLNRFLVLDAILYISVANRNATGAQLSQIVGTWNHGFRLPLQPRYLQECEGPKITWLDKMVGMYHMKSMKWKNERSLNYFLRM